MYQYPYGDYQQLNLDWIINKIRELENLEAEEIDLEEVANALISLTYSSTQTYNNSDIVFYDGHLYRCNTTIPAPGEAWDPSHWDQIMLGNTVANLVRAVAGMSSDNVFNESRVSGVHVTEALNSLVEDVRYNNHWIQQKKTGAYSNAVQIEDTPSNSSNKLASSKAVYDVKTDLDTVIPLDASPTVNSTKGVTSGGVKTAITAAQSAIQSNLQSDLSSYVTTWLANNFNPSTELPLDETLSIHGAAADAMATGQADFSINKVLQFITEQLKNLVDPRKIIYGYLNAGLTMVTGTAGDNAFVYIECEPSTTYYIKKSGGNYLSVWDTPNLPAIGGTGYNRLTRNGQTDATFTTSANAAYLCVYFWYRPDGNTLSDALDNLLIIKSSTAANYSKPYTAIDSTARNALVNVLKRQPDLANNQDLNDLVDAGWYFGSVGHTYGHQPPQARVSGNVRFIIMYPEINIGATTYRHQWFFSIREGLMAFRTYSTSTLWQPWRIYSPSKLNRIIGNYWGASFSGNTINDGEKLKLATWNICHFNYDTATLIGNGFTDRLYIQKKLLMEMDADILFIQEDAQWLDSAHNHSSLNYFYKPIYPYKYGTSDKNPIYSKKPLTFLEEYNFNDGTNRTATFCKTTINSKTLLIVNYHAVVNAAQQATQWTNLVNHIKTYTYDYLILGGDFNTETQTQLDRVANTATSENWIMCNGGYLGYICTWFENDFDRNLDPEAIDHIVVSNNIIPNKIKTYQEYAYYMYTDHIPLTTELAFT